MLIRILNCIKPARWLLHTRTRNTTQLESLQTHPTGRDKIGNSRPLATTLVLYYGLKSYIPISQYLSSLKPFDHLKNSASDAILTSKLSNSFYVDDKVTGADNEETAYHLYLTAKEIMKAGGFNLQKFTSSSPLLQSWIQNSESCNEPTVSPCVIKAGSTFVESSIGPNQNVCQGERKVLGVCWDVANDVFIFNLQELACIAESLKSTKRNIVSLVGKVYDPLGFLAPVVIRLKVFLQELCKVKLDWDQPLPSDLEKKWRLLVSDLREGWPISIPRCYWSSISGKVSSLMLCGYCDASQKAHAAVVYLRSTTDSEVSVRLVASKTRVSPLKKQTISRLELLSALLLARLITSVTQTLQPELPLSDSMISLCWIKGSDKCWKPFVQKRVNAIKKLLPPNCWKHCRSQENPADIPSSGLPPLELSVNALWHNSPEWLQTDDLCANDSTVLTPPAECLAEMKTREVKQVHGLLSIEDPVRLSQIIECEHFSSLDCLFSVTALVFKFCALLCNVVRTLPKDANWVNHSVEEIWILESQQSLTKEKKFKHWRKESDLFQDDRGIWRCRGRIQNAGVPYSTKHPILLLSSHHLTLLLVRKAHDRVLHNGVKETLTELRSKFWIVKGRSYIRKVLRQCRVCRRHEGKPYSAPPPPPLPSLRVSEAPPFSFTGVDLAGPLYVKDGHTSSKVWICLYTCCVTRAVHLDLVSDMSTPTFLRSFKRFAARRGLPSQMLSDNGKTFEAAAKTIHDVKWKFNVPKAPWWGGVFERIVRSAKRCLKKILGQARFSHDELLTAITEVEMVINSRPLSFVSSNDLEEPLTPSHLMVGRRLMNQPDYSGQDMDDFETTQDDITCRAKYLCITINQFWERWRKEYLLELREAHKQHSQKSNMPNISVGDVVIIHDDDQARCMWKLGRVEKLLVGADDEIRAAVLKVAGHGRAANHLQRPVQKLYPLEMSSHDHFKTADDSIIEPTSTRNLESGETENTRPEQAPDVNSTPSPHTVRTPKRRAALEARDRVLAQSIEETSD